jgi:phosphatidylserine/phosphatidylglycerophosphate/cardiolipin synthase-like enzyme
MAAIAKAYAFSNDQVGYLAWRLDVGVLPGCLGFHVVRELLDAEGKVTAEAPLTSYIGFETQKNPDWRPQNTSVWPVQKLNWRDLGLRKFCDDNGAQPAGTRVRYRIRAVGDLQPGLEAVKVVTERHWNSATKAYEANTYEGAPRPLGYLTGPAWTNAIEVTAHRPPFRVTFNNGILSTQFLTNVSDAAQADGKAFDLAARLQDPADKLRGYMAGNILHFMRDMFESTQGGRFRIALYELEDEELVPLLEKHASRIDLILADAGEASKSAPTVFDTRNGPARARLQTIADSPANQSASPDQQFRLQNRMFSGSGHIGHNKFVVYLPEPGKASCVLTGSTNWTWSGVTAQANNCIIIEDPKIAWGFAEYWQYLCDDKLPVPVPISAANTKAHQGDALKTANQEPVRSNLPDGAIISSWFSPNMIGKNSPPAKSQSQPAPPDMAELFGLIAKAQQAIFFLVFNPSKGGDNSIITQAVTQGLANPALNVLGAVSSGQAMWDESEVHKKASGGKAQDWTPFVFQQGGVSVVRASALADKAMAGTLGDFKFYEKLTAFGGVGAIIHDKVVVIDPMDPKNCVVAFGSHNLGYKASYCNDENLTIVTGHQPLSLAYTAHVLDIYDHYRFRAKQNEKTPASKKPGGTEKPEGFTGFLSVSPDWQKTAGHRLSDYFAG